jgi:hypothetical protein
MGKNKPRFSISVNHEIDPMQIAIDRRIPIFGLGRELRIDGCLAGSSSLGFSWTSDTPQSAQVSNSGLYSVLHLGHQGISLASFTYDITDSCGADFGIRIPK